MKIHLLSGFLGSGKTTAIFRAAQHLIQTDQKVGIIVNDQGGILVDHALFKGHHLPSKQVINGCFCCNYQDLEDNIQALLEEHQVEVIFAESVGSCTDLVATVLKPLLKYHPHTVLSLSTFVDVRLLRLILSGAKLDFDESVLYIFNKQIEEAEVMVLNKIDLLSAEELAEVKLQVQKNYPNKTILFQNSFETSSLQNWLETLCRKDLVYSLAPLEIDYDLYAEGEARLAWLDQSMEILGINAQQGAKYLMEEIYQQTQSQGYPIGHLKFLVDGINKISFTAQSSVSYNPPATPQSSVHLLLNIRVQSSPEAILQLINEACKNIENQYNYKINMHSQSAFQPGYPQPFYRMS